MTLKQLQTFYWACRLGSFSAASRRLYTTQSAVSMRIRDLETSLGVILFDRSQRATTLTAKGQELLRHVEQLIPLLAGLEHSVSDANVLCGNLRLGVTELVALTWLPQFVSAIHDTYPQIVVELDVDLALSQIEKLRAADLDVALVPGPVSEAGLAAVSLGSVKFAWMASPRLEIPAGRLTAGSLQSLPLIAPHQNSKLYAVLEDWLSQSQLTIWRTDVCNSISVLAAMTLAGLGVTYLPRHFYRREVRDQRLRILDIRPALPDLEYFAVFDRRRAQPLARAISDLAQAQSTFANTAVARSDTAGKRTIPGNRAKRQQP